MSEIKSVLVALSDEAVRNSVKENLEALNHRVVVASYGNEARLKFDNEAFCLVIIDLELQGFKVKSFVENVRKKEQLKNIKDHIPFIILSDKPDVFAVHFAAIDNVTYLPDYFNVADLKDKVSELLREPSQIQKNSRAVKEGAILIKEGGQSQEMFWILSGSFEVIKKNSNEKEVVIGKISPGELVGEMSFLDDLPRSASVRALEDSEVLVIPQKKFLDILDSQPRWFRSLMKTLSCRLREADIKIAEK